MSRRRGSSRTLGPTRQCAVYVRGGCCCAWCLVVLASSGEATIEHLDGDSRNNKPENLVPACRWCNRERQDHWPDGDVSEWTPINALIVAPMLRFDEYLVRRGSSLLAAVQRIELQRVEPLPIEEGRALAKQWHAARFAWDRVRDKRRRDARKLDDPERLAIKSAHRGAEATFP